MKPLGKIIFFLVYLSSTFINSQTSTLISFTNPGTGYTLSGNVVTIISDGTYDLKGSETNKQIKISSSATLVLNSFSLINTNTQTPLIVNANNIVKLNLTGESTFQDYSTNENTGVIYLRSSSSLTIGGKGTLNINPNKSMAIYGITGTSLNVNDGANIKISSSLSTIGGIYVLGIITFNNAIFTHNCPNGRYSAIYVQGDVYIIKGTYNISSGRGLGINCEGNLYLGQINGNNSDLILDINSSNDGIEAKNMEVSSGIININAGEEGINIDGPNDICDNNIRCAGNCACSLTFKKGNLTLNSREDGINANGDITFSGGNIVIFAYGGNDANPIEQDGRLSITGGNIIAAGTARNARVYATTTQKAKTYSGTVNIGDRVEIFSKNNNNEIFGLTTNRAS